jgi:hypothetical protein
MDEQDEHSPRESVHIRIPKDLWKKLEEMRKTSHSNFKLPRSTVYEEALYLGERLMFLKKEIGEKEFSRIWHWLNKLDFGKVDIEKLKLI